MWKKLSANSLEHQPWELLVKHSVAFKAKVTTEDPKEQGLRKILNAGHTIGHALETHLLNNRVEVTHGEAVAAGLAMEAWIAEQRRLISADELHEIVGYLLSIYPPVTIDTDADESICRLILQDKKNRDNKILCVLLNGIGHAQWDYAISIDEVRRALMFYRSMTLNHHGSQT